MCKAFYIDNVENNFVNIGFLGKAKSCTSHTFLQLNTIRPNLSRKYENHNFRLELQPSRY